MPVPGQGMIGCSPQAAMHNPVAMAMRALCTRFMESPGKKLRILRTVTARLRILPPVDYPLFCKRFVLESAHPHRRCQR